LKMLEQPQQSPGRSCEDELSSSVSKTRHRCADLFAKRRRTNRFSSAVRRSV
jgi:hypothetical protein